MRWITLAIMLAATTGLAGEPTLRDYDLPDQLQPLPPRKASLYRTPWRSNVRTASAHESLKGIGVYYKHVPNDWTIEQHAHVMGQMAEAGVRRVRLAPHFGLYIHPEWATPSDVEMRSLRNELRAAHRAGLRPCVIFVHIPPYGKAGTDELQRWWKRNWNTNLLPVGEVGSPQFDAYLTKTYQALRFILTEARKAGFTEADSWDLELGQGMWWGAPAVPHPPPSTTLADMRPGGRIFEFESRLIQQLRDEGFSEPSVWWGMTHHVFDEYREDDMAPAAVGRAISFYASGIGWSDTYFEGEDKVAPAADTWPLRDPMSWLEGEIPRLVLARPEGYMADFSRHDNLIGLLRRLPQRLAITSLGTVPSSIPEARSGGLSGWQLKQRGLARSLAFWLNQGAEFVLLHSAYEGKDDEMSHALIPFMPSPENLKWSDAPPLVTLRSFCDELTGAKPLDAVTPLRFRYALDEDAVLIPAAGDTGPLHASDAVALMTFQLDARSFAVAAWVVTPNVARPLAPATLTLQIDRPMRKCSAEVVQRDDTSTTLRLPIRDEVTWVRFDVAD